MKRFLVVLLFEFVILIVFSQPVKKPDEDNGTNIPNNEVQHRYRRTIYEMTPLCNINQYYDEDERQCLSVVGGGRVLYINNTISCGINILKPHCFDPKYYYICKINKTLLAQCGLGKYFAKELQKCVLYPTHVYSTNLASSSTDSVEPIEIPGCTQIGLFTIPGECALFYTCDWFGQQMRQTFYRCPNYMAYDPQTKMCKYSSACQHMLSLPCTLNVQKENVPLENAEQPGSVSNIFTLGDGSNFTHCETVYANEEAVTTIGFDTTTIASTTETTMAHSGSDIVSENKDKFMSTTVSYTPQTVSEHAQFDNNFDITSTTELVSEMSRTTYIVKDDTTATYPSTKETTLKEGIFYEHSTTDITATECGTTATVQNVQGTTTKIARPVEDTNTQYKIVSFSPDVGSSAAFRPMNQLLESTTSATVSPKQQYSTTETSIATEVETPTEFGTTERYVESNTALNILSEAEYDATEAEGIERGLEIEGSTTGDKSVAEYKTSTSPPVTSTARDDSSITEMEVKTSTEYSTSRPITELTTNEYTTSGLQHSRTEGEQITQQSSTTIVSTSAVESTEWETTTLNPVTTTRSAVPSINDKEVTKSTEYHTSRPITEMTMNEYSTSGLEQITTEGDQITQQSSTTIVSSPTQESTECDITTLKPVTTTDSSVSIPTETGVKTTLQFNTIEDLLEMTTALNIIAEAEYTKIDDDRMERDLETSVSILSNESVTGYKTTTSNPVTSTGSGEPSTTDNEVTPSTEYHTNSPITDMTTNEYTTSGLEQSTTQRDEITQQSSTTIVSSPAEESTECDTTTLKPVTTTGSGVPSIADKEVTPSTEYHTSRPITEVTTNEYTTSGLEQSTTEGEEITQQSSTTIVSTSAVESTEWETTTLKPVTTTGSGVPSIADKEVTPSTEYHASRPITEMTATEYTTSGLEQSTTETDEITQQSGTTIVSTSAVESTEWEITTHKPVTTTRTGEPSIADKEVALSTEYHASLPITEMTATEYTTSGLEQSTTEADEITQHSGTTTVSTSAVESTEWEITTHKPVTTTRTGEPSIADKEVALSTEYHTSRPITEVTTNEYSTSGLQQSTTEGDEITQQSSTTIVSSPAEESTEYDITTLQPVTTTGSGVPSITDKEVTPSTEYHTSRPITEMTMNEYTTSGLEQSTTEADEITQQSSTTIVSSHAEESTEYDITTLRPVTTTVSGVPSITDKEVMPSTIYDTSRPITEMSTNEYTTSGLEQSTTEGDEITQQSSTTIVSSPAEESTEYDITTLQPVTTTGSGVPSITDKEVTPSTEYHTSRPITEVTTNEYTTSGLEQSTTEGEEITQQSSTTIVSTSAVESTEWETTTLKPVTTTGSGVPSITDKEVTLSTEYHTSRPITEVTTNEYSTSGLEQSTTEGDEVTQQSSTIVCSPAEESIECDTTTLKPVTTTASGVPSITDQEVTPSTEYHTSRPITEMTATEYTTSGLEQSTTEADEITQQSGTTIVSTSAVESTEWEITTHKPVTTTRTGEPSIADKEVALSTEYHASLPITEMTATEYTTSGLEQSTTEADEITQHSGTTTVSTSAVESTEWEITTHKPVTTTRTGEPSIADKEVALSTEYHTSRPITEVTTNEYSTSGLQQSTTEGDEITQQSSTTIVSSPAEESTEYDITTLQPVTTTGSGVPSITDKEVTPSTEYHTSRPITEMTMNEYTTSGLEQSTTEADEITQQSSTTIVSSHAEESTEYDITTLRPVTTTVSGVPSITDKEVMPSTIYHTSRPITEMSTNEYTTSGLEQSTTEGDEITQQSSTTIVSSPAEESTEYDITTLQPVTTTGSGVPSITDKEVTPSTEYHTSRPITEVTTNEYTTSGLEQSTTEGEEITQQSSTTIVSTSAVESTEWETTTLKPVTTTGSGVPSITDKEVTLSTEYHTSRPITEVTTNEYSTSGLEQSTTEGDEVTQQSSTIVCSPAEESIECDTTTLKPVTTTASGVPSITDQEVTPSTEYHTSRPITEMTATEYTTSGLEQSTTEADEITQQSGTTIVSTSAVESTEWEITTHKPVTTTRTGEPSIADKEVALSTEYHASLPITEMTATEYTTSGLEQSTTEADEITQHSGTTTVSTSAVESTEWEITTHKPVTTTRTGEPSIADKEVALSTEYHTSRPITEVTTNEYSTSGLQQSTTEGDEITQQSSTTIVSSPAEESTEYDITTLQPVSTTGSGVPSITDKEVTPSTEYHTSRPITEMTMNEYTTSGLEQSTTEADEITQQSSTTIVSSHAEESTEYDITTLRPVTTTVSGVPSITDKEVMPSTIYHTSRPITEMSTNEYTTSGLEQSTTEGDEITQQSSTTIVSSPAEESTEYDITTLQPVTTTGSGVPSITDKEVTPSTEYHTSRPITEVTTNEYTTSGLEQSTTEGEEITQQSSTTIVSTSAVESTEWETTTLKPVTTTGSGVPSITDKEVTLSTEYHTSRPITEVTTNEYSTSGLEQSTTEGDEVTQQSSTIVCSPAEESIECDTTTLKPVTTTASGVPSITDQEVTPSTEYHTSRPITEMTATEYTTSGLEQSTTEADEITQQSGTTIVSTSAVESTEWEITTHKPVTTTRTGEPSIADKEVALSTEYHASLPITEMTATEYTTSGLEQSTTEADEITQQSGTTIVSTSAVESTEWEITTHKPVTTTRTGEPSIADKEVALSTEYHASLPITEMTATEYTTSGLEQSTTEADEIIQQSGTTIVSTSAVESTEWEITTHKPVTTTRTGEPSIADKEVALSTEYHTSRPITEVTTNEYSTSGLQQTTTEGDEITQQSSTTIVSSPAEESTEYDITTLQPVTTTGSGVPSITDKEVTPSTEYHTSRPITEMTMNEYTTSGLEQSTTEADEITQQSSTTIVSSPAEESTEYDITTLQPVTTTGSGVPGITDKEVTPSTEYHTSRPITEMTMNEYTTSGLEQSTTEADEITQQSSTTIVSSHAEESTEYDITTLRPVTTTVSGVPSITDKKVMPSTIYHTSRPITEMSTNEYTTSGLEQSTTEGDEITQQSSTTIVSTSAMESTEWEITTLKPVTTTGSGEPSISDKEVTLSTEYHTSRPITEVTTNEYSTSGLQQTTTEGDEITQQSSTTIVSSPAEESTEYDITTLQPVTTTGSGVHSITDKEVTPSTEYHTSRPITEMTMNEYTTSGLEQSTTEADEITQQSGTTIVSTSAVESTEWEITTLKPVTTTGSREPSISDKEVTLSTEYHTSRPITEVTTNEYTTSGLELSTTEGDEITQQSSTTIVSSPAEESTEYDITTLQPVTTTGSGVPSITDKEVTPSTEYHTSRPITEVTTNEYTTSGLEQSTTEGEEITQQSSTTIVSTSAVESTEWETTTLKPVTTTGSGVPSITDKEVTLSTEYHTSRPITEVTTNEYSTSGLEQSTTEGDEVTQQSSTIVCSPAEESIECDTTTLKPVTTTASGVPSITDQEVTPSTEYHTSLPITEMTATEYTTSGLEQSTTEADEITQQSGTTTVSTSAVESTEWEITTLKPVTTTGSGEPSISDKEVTLSTEYHTSRPITEVTTNEYSTSGLQQSTTEGDEITQQSSTTIVSSHAEESTEYDITTLRPVTTTVSGVPSITDKEVMPSTIYHTSRPITEMSTNEYTTSGLEQSTTEGAGITQQSSTTIVSSPAEESREWETTTLNPVTATGSGVPSITDTDVTPSTEYHISRPITEVTTNEYTTSGLEQSTTEADEITQQSGTTIVSTSAVESTEWEITTLKPVTTTGSGVPSITDTDVTPSTEYHISRPITEVTTNEYSSSGLQQSTTEGDEITQQSSTTIVSSPAEESREWEITTLKPVTTTGSREPSISDKEVTLSTEYHTSRPIAEMTTNEYSSSGLQQSTTEGDEITQQSSTTIVSSPAEESREWETTTLIPVTTTGSGVPSITDTDVTPSTEYHISRPITEVTTNEYTTSGLEQSTSERDQITQQSSTTIVSSPAEENTECDTTTLKPVTITVSGVPSIADKEVALFTGYHTSRPITQVTTNEYSSSGLGQSTIEGDEITPHSSMTIVSSPAEKSTEWETTTHKSVTTTGLSVSSTTETGVKTSSQFHTIDDLLEIPTALNITAETEYSKIDDERIERDLDTSVSTVSSVSVTVYKTTTRNPVTSTVSGEPSIADKEVTLSTEYYTGRPITEMTTNEYTTSGLEQSTTEGDKITQQSSTTIVSSPAEESREWETTTLNPVTTTGSGVPSIADKEVTVSTKYYTRRPITEVTTNEYSTTGLEQSTTEGDKITQQSSTTIVSSPAEESREWETTTLNPVTTTGSGVPSITDTEVTPSTEYHISRPITEVATNEYTTSRLEQSTTERDQITQQSSTTIVSSPAEESTECDTTILKPVTTTGSGVPSITDTDVTLSTEYHTSRPITEMTTNEYTTSGLEQSTTEGDEITQQSGTTMFSTSAVESTEWETTGLKPVTTTGSGVPSITDTDVTLSTEYHTSRPITEMTTNEYTTSGLEQSTTEGDQSTQQSSTTIVSSPAEESTEWETTTLKPVTTTGSGEPSIIGTDVTPSIKYHTSRLITEVTTNEYTTRLEQSTTESDQITQQSSTTIVSFPAEESTECDTTILKPVTTTGSGVPSIADKEVTLSTEYHTSRPITEVTTIEYSTSGLEQSTTEGDEITQQSSTTIVSSPAEESTEWETTTLKPVTTTGSGEPSIIGTDVTPSTEYHTSRPITEVATNEYTTSGLEQSTTEGDQIIQQSSTKIISSPGQENTGCEIFTLESVTTPGSSVPSTTETGVQTSARFNTTEDLLEISTALNIIAEKEYSKIDDERMQPDLETTVSTLSNASVTVYQTPTSNPETSTSPGVSIIAEAEMKTSTISPSSDTITVTSVNDEDMRLVTSFISTTYSSLIPGNDESVTEKFAAEAFGDQTIPNVTDVLVPLRTMNVEDLLALCRAYALAEASKRQAESSTSRSVVTDVEAYPTDTTEESTAPCETETPMVNNNVAIQSGRTLSKNVVLPIASAVLDVADKLERRLRVILAELLRRSNL